MELAKIAERAVEAATAAGAGDAEAYVQDSVGREIRVFDGEVESLTDAARLGTAEMLARLRQRLESGLKLLQVREPGLLAPSSDVARSVPSRPISSASSTCGDRPMPKPSPVCLSPSDSAIAWMYANAVVASHAPDNPADEASATRCSSSA